MRQFIYLSLHAYSVFNKIDLERLLLFSLQSRWTCLNVCKCGSRDAFATYETNPNNHDVKLREHGLYENCVSNEHEKEQEHGRNGVSGAEDRHVVEPGFAEESYEDADRPEAYAGEERQ